MDDIILTGDNLIKFEVFKNCFAKLFKIKDLETLRYVLGMKLARSKKGFFFVTKDTRFAQRNRIARV